MNRPLNVRLYEKMYLIRKAEEAIQEYYPEDDMKTPMHMSMGEEAIVAGVCEALDPEDQVLGTYRSHALYLAKTSETNRFFAEMYGKATGVARGKAGSMHLSSFEHGLLCSSAIVASSIPVALGVAFANKYKNRNKKVVVFFGDGAVDEGSFWESVNFAGLKKLPLLFVCEDNGLAVHTRREDRQGYSSINKVISQFHFNVFEANTTDAEVICNMTSQAIRAMERNKMPCFVRLHYYRCLEHVGISEDFDAGYRSRKEYLGWLKKDPVMLQRKKLCREGISEEEVVAVERRIEQTICGSIELAKRADFGSVSELYEGVYRCE